MSMETHEYHDAPIRELTADEAQFVSEAKAGHFGVLYAADGHPFAMGAPKTSNLFDGDVEEIDDPYSHGSIYRLRVS
jgi:hypothetical protein